jgi:hypothetical protein
MYLGHATDRPKDTFRFLNLEMHKVIMSRNVIWMDAVYGDYKKMLESDIARIIEVDDNDDSNTEAQEINPEGSDNNETTDDEQDPVSSVDKNQFTGIGGDDSDEETMDKSDREVLVHPKVAWELSKLSA